MRYDGDLDGGYLSGKFGDFLKRAVSNVAKVTGSLQEIVQPQAAAVPLPPPKPAINPLVIGGIAAGGLALILLLKKR